MPDRDPARTSRAGAWTFVVNSLAARAQSVAEIERKLASRGVSPEVAQDVVADAVRLGYLDDETLAEQLAQGFRTRRYGRRRAATAMRHRGLEAGLAESALDAAYGDTDESQLAVSALGGRPTGDERSRRRAVAFLIRRGFSPGAAWEAVRRADDTAGSGDG